MSVTDEVSDSLHYNVLEKVNKEQSLIYHKIEKIEKQKAKEQKAKEKRAALRKEKNQRNLTKCFYRLIDKAIQAKELGGEVSFVHDFGEELSSTKQAMDEFDLLKKDLEERFNNLITLFAFGRFWVQPFADGIWRRRYRQKMTLVLHSENLCEFFAFLKTKAKEHSEATLKERRRKYCSTLEKVRPLFLGEKQWFFITRIIIQAMVAYSLVVCIASLFSKPIDWSFTVLVGCIPIILVVSVFVIKFLLSEEYKEIMRDDNSTD